MIPRIGMAQAAVARFDGILQAMINPELLLSPLNTQEAVLSSRIEGTQASLEDVLRHDADPKHEVERLNDIQEVQNYRKAMEHAVGLYKKGHLNLEGLLEVHKILMRGVRGEGKHPGRIRTIQNYIGYKGDPIEKAVFVPPTPEALSDALEDFFSFLLSTQKDTLVQTACAHAQFELIHPFLDGNGRVGRMLIPLQFFGKGLISHPNFYISEYFDEHRTTYYNKLSGISRDQDWQGWVDFFLEGVQEQAELNIQRALSILQLYTQMKDSINRITRSQHALETLDALFRHPFTTAMDFTEQTGLSRRTSYRILENLLNSDVLTLSSPAQGSRPAVYCFEELISITHRRLF